MWIIKKITINDKKKSAIAILKTKEIGIKRYINSINENKLFLFIIIDYIGENKF